MLTQLLGRIEESCSRSFGRLGSIHEQQAWRPRMHEAVQRLVPPTPLSPLVSSGCYRIRHTRLLSAPQRLFSRSYTAALSRKFYPIFTYNVEDVEEYRADGYHPLHLGDVWINRYKIIHKLGSGGFSTTWLARDLAQRKYCALKVLKAEEAGATPEIRVLQWLDTLHTDHPGRRHIRRLLNQFSIDGPNGRHNCLVHEVGGPSLASLYNVPLGYTAGARRLRADLAHDAIRQIVEAVDLLHSYRTCHGDLTLPNVLLTLKQIHHWTEDDVYNRLGSPVKTDVRPTPGATVGDSAPRYIVEPARLPDANFLSHEVQLIDFGETFPFDKPPRPEHIGIPDMYRAPETIYESKLAHKSEIWSLGCLLFEIRAGGPLFASLMGGSDEIVAQVVDTLGKLPEPWWSMWPKRSQYFDDEGISIDQTYVPATVPATPLRTLIKQIGGADDEVAFSGPEVAILEPKDTRVPPSEIESMNDLLRCLLTYNPEERLTARQVLEHPWVSGLS